MVIINRSNREYKIYREEEAKGEGIEYVEWKEGKKGEWVKSDDGWVSELLNRSIYQGKKNKFLKMEILRLPYRDLYITYYTNLSGIEKVYNDRLIAEPFLRDDITDRKRSKTWTEEVLGRPEYRLILEIYYSMLLKGEVTKKGIKTLGKIFFPGSNFSHKRIIKILMNKGVQKYMLERIEADLKKIGIENPQTYGLELLKKAADIGLEKKDAYVLTKVAKEINTLIGVYNKRDTQDPQYLPSNSKEITEANIIEESKIIELQKKELE